MIRIIRASNKEHVSTSDVNFVRNHVASNIWQSGGYVTWPAARVVGISWNMKIHHPLLKRPSGASIVVDRIGTDRQTNGVLQARLAEDDKMRHEST